ncbi:hypothetical protein AXG93_2018s1010 [Marchantia polymorpha subsp. ruderalis]|uniref:Uncharacterized protein n=1 Tax=Marchantia polymorpha subsp. ruderalis TaxID=1480154 RepID=A0A176WCU4_MARPO|nr:hypothetical protein AXG93_2018s1010 [Marchantia polymorpha subsp. ruderalis]
MGPEDEEVDFVCGRSGGDTFWSRKDLPTDHKESPPSDGQCPWRIFAAAAAAAAGVGVVAVAKLGSDTAHFSFLARGQVGSDSAIVGVFWRSRKSDGCSTTSRLASLADST